MAAVSLFFHLIATAVWIGGLLLMVLLVIPETRRAMQQSPGLYDLLTRLRKRMAPLFNLSLAVLIVTGMFQMSLDPNYDGLMQFDNEWSRVILFKHIALVGLVISGGMLQFSVIPSMERAALLIERGKGDPNEIERLRRRETVLSWISAGLGVLILGFSAWAGSL